MSVNAEPSSKLKEIIFKPTARRELVINQTKTHQLISGRSGRLISGESHEAFFWRDSSSYCRLYRTKVENAVATAIHKPGYPSRNPRRNTYARKKRQSGRATFCMSDHRFPS